MPIMAGLWAGAYRIDKNRCLSGMAVVRWAQMVRRDSELRRVVSMDRIWRGIIMLGRMLVKSYDMDDLREEVEGVKGDLVRLMRIQQIGQSRVWEVTGRGHH